MAPPKKWECCICFEGYEYPENEQEDILPLEVAMRDDGFRLKAPFECKNHWFHENCIKNYEKANWRGVTCPMCREKRRTNFRQ